MWLINTRTLALEQTYDPSAIKYAILSHAWEGDEVTFQDMAYLPKAKGKAGFAKIANFCEMALETEGLEYAWVDTCCIDKTSSAELSEAINSMFHWYRQADVCFVLLSDLPPQTRPQPSPAWPFRGPPEDAAVLGASRWFSRGWTLQELIAPAYVKFYDAGWQYRFTKDGEAWTLSAITGIDHDVLALKKELTAVPVAVKMSWASCRETTGVEDRAYSLLGLFDINMPMLYGEGHKAFQPTAPG
ncbi:HET-domain-containing protein [Colletotrichum falcatum]|nr:HET-domain-containing protein [Colletotrichum falcatum]